MRPSAILEGAMSGAHLWSKAPLRRVQIGALVQRNSVLCVTPAQWGAARQELGIPRGSPGDPERPRAARSACGGEKIAAARVASSGAARLSPSQGCLKCGQVWEGKMKVEHARQRMSARACASALLIGVAGAALLAPAQAAAQQAGATDELRSYDIEAQPLSSALDIFARQSGLQVLTPHDRLVGLNAPSLHGVFTPQSALERLLSASPLQGRIEAHAILIIDTRSPQGRSAGADILPQDAPALLERAQRGAAETANALNAGDNTEIVVTGSRIRGAAPAGANLITLGAEALQETGRSTLQDALATLPQNFGGGQNETTQLQSTNGGSNTTFGSAINLRGLGSDATLALVNGRRLAPGGQGNFIDISNVPMAAVERVEILADGASATYGSDAVAGVVNIVLRRDFEGLAATGRYGGVTDGGLRETDASLVAGAVYGPLSVLGGYEFRDRGALGLDERALSADSDLRRFGGDNFSRNTSNPGNITRIGATPVTIAIPGGQDGSSLDEGDLLYGQVNLQNLNEDGDLYPSQQSQHLFTSLRFEPVPVLSLFIDAFAGVREAEARDPQLSTTFSVPETNAWRVLNGLFTGQGPLTMAYNFGADLGPLRYETRAESVLLITGFEWDVTRAWQIEATASFATQTEDQHFLNAFSSAGLAAALASGNLDTAFNPFADGSNSNPAVLRSLTFRQDAHADSSMEVFSLKADGPLLALPAGRLRAAFGIERRNENFAFTVQRTSAAGVVTALPTFPEGERSTDALFGEIFAPLVSPEMGIPLVHALDLSLSLRRETSPDYGEAETPKIGVNWGLSEDLTIRGSWGQSFKAPQFNQLLGEVTGQMGAAPPSIDPNADNGSTGLLQIGGPNPNLEPERGETWTVGFDYRPSWADGLSLHATYFDIAFRDRIARAGVITAAFRDPGAYAGFLILDPTQDQIDLYLSYADRVTGVMPPDGIEAIWDGRLTNLASLNVRGVDLSARYTHDTSWGEFGANVSASGLLEYATSPLASLPTSDLLNTFANPVDWRGRIGISWRAEDWAALATFNYTNGYDDTVTIPNRQIESWTSWDLYLSRQWGEDERGRREIALSVQNLFDEAPPFVNNPLGVGFDPANASLLGRFIAIEVRQRW